MRIREMTHDLEHDVRFTVRTLRRDAGFTLFATGIIALGIGAAITVFSVADALLVRPLPFRDPDRLVWIANNGGAGLSSQTVQVGNFVDFGAQTKSFSEVAAYFAFYGVGDRKLGGAGEAVRLSAVPVTRNFFSVLGVRPFLGRLFTAEESAWNGPKAVLLGYELWKTRYASNPDVVGKPVMLDDDPVRVVGVLPPSFDFGSIFAPGAKIDLFVPFPLSDETNHWGNTLSIVGRLEPGVSIASASAELNLLGDRITTAHRGQRNRFRPVAVSLREHVSGRVRRAITVLAFAVGVVMLIVCANLSNLLLARATTRQREMAIRAALGAGRRRLVRQMLTESVVLSSGGAALGLVLAIIGTRAVARLDAVALPLLGSVRIDASAVLFALLLAVGTGVAFGIVPAFHLPASLHDVLKASGRGLSDGKHHQWMRSVLVVSEIALAGVLLVASGLLVHSFLNVLDVDLGFRPESASALRVDPDRLTADSQPRFNAYMDEVLRRSGAIPGVRAVALTDALPLGSNRSWGVRAKGVAYRHEWPNAFVRVVSEGYIGTMGMRLRAGRDLSVQDGQATEPVILVNETAARTLWPGENAIGKILIADKERRVVGIVGDVRHLAVEQGAGLEMYLPLRQSRDHASLTLVVRSNLTSAALASSLRTALAPLVPNLPTNDLRTLTEIVDKAVSPRRFLTVLLGAFAGFALVLALLGIYGVISYTVSQRTHEIGVRIALGASSRNVQGRIIRETLTLAAIGIAVGAFASWITARALASFLFGVTPADPPTFAAMLAVLTTVSVASGYVPARRASRIDPITALRSV
jgi:putative ABC transport system permease protein